MSNLKKTSSQRAAKGQLKIADHISFTPPFWTLAGILLIIAAVFCVYLPSINGGFIIDDDTLVSESRIIKAADGLARIWSSEKTVDFWPATNTSFWIEWRLWKMHPTGYHATNLILHVAEAFLIWLILRKLSIPGAFLAALIFALHPVNVESVAWISSRKNLTAMLFFLLSIYWYLKTLKRTATQTAQNHPEDNHREAESGFPHPSSFIPHPSSYYWLSLAAFLLAMLGKGSAAVTPLLLLGITWWFRPVTRRDLMWTAPFFLVAVALVVVNMWFQTHGSGEPYHTATLTESLLGAGGVIWFYLYKALMPLDLAFVYPQWKIAAGNLLWWLPLAAAVAVTLVLWLCRKGWGRPLLFSWGFFCVALLPVMGFADVGFMQYSLVANRHEHIAIIAVIALALAPFCIWHGRMSGATRWIASGIIVAAVAILAFFTWRESGLYHDEFKLYQVTLEKNPSCWMAHNNWGLALDKAGRTEEAIAHYRQALALKPDYPEAHNNWGLALNKTGRGEEAIEHFQRALDIKPDYYNAHNNWGIVLDKMGRFREAIDHYKLALVLTTDNPEIYNNLGASLIQTGRPEEGIAECEHALAIDQDYAQAHSNLGSALMQTNRVREAIEHFKQALELKPDYTDAYINLGGALVKAGHLQEAIDYCRQALEIDPNSAEAHNTMGNALQALGAIRRQSNSTRRRWNLNRTRLRRISTWAACWRKWARFRRPSNITGRPCV